MSLKFPQELGCFVINILHDWGAVVTQNDIIVTQYHPGIMSLIFIWHNFNLN